MKYSSQLIEDAVNSFSSLPGIGRKTALRLALHLIAADKQKAIQLGNSVIKMSENIQCCQTCFSFSDTQICNICNNPSRNQKIVCVVETIRDLMAIEDIQHYQGVYHVLGGLISPIDGIGPDQLNLEVLFQRIEKENIEEIILAVRPSIEGDTTAYYIARHVRNKNLTISLLARGVSFGSDLEFADELTLSRSMLQRTPYLLQDNNAV